MITAKEIRARAREALEYRIFGSAWLYAVAACLIVSLLVSVIGAVPFVGVIISFILAGPIYMGLACYFRNVAERKENANRDIGALFDPLRTDAGGSIVTGLLVNVFTYLWSLLFVIPGIVKSFSYSMTYYIKLDHPEYTARQAIDESRRMMDGHKFRLFCLDLSFIGWMFVGVLALGIGVLWVQPYMEAARYEFYCDLKFSDYTKPNQNQSI